MSEERRSVPIKRILVALDASPHSLAALDAAVELAARFQAELVGLFVEDENLLRLANLPFAQEVGLYSATRRRVEIRELERQIRGLGRRARRVFIRTTERSQVTRSFRVVRGSVLSEVLNAASEADMLVLGKAGWSLLQRERLGSTVRGILPERFGMALILKEKTCLGVPLAVVYDGSPAAERALDTADTMRQQPEDDKKLLIVLLLTEDEQKIQELQRQSAGRLEERAAVVHYHALTSTNVLRLVDVLQGEECGMLILPAQGIALQSSVVEQLLEQIELPVLLVT